MPAPLDGIRVLDFTRFQNGPHATVMLSDMGAEILKVERPGEGDPGRALGRRSDGFCSHFEALARGKKSITLDLDQPERASPSSAAATSLLSRSPRRRSTSCAARRRRRWKSRWR